VRFLKLNAVGTRRIGAVSAMKRVCDDGWIGIGGPGFGDEATPFCLCGFIEPMRPDACIAQSLIVGNWFESGGCTRRTFEPTYFMGRNWRH
jgi:hypothetical protein